MSKQHQTGTDTITRRKFMKRIGLGAAGLGAGSILSAMPKIAKAAPATRDFILVGYPESLTGSLAGLGEPTHWTVNKLTNKINSDGGIFIKEANRKLPVQFKVSDTQSDPTKSSDAATRLIVGDKVDMMLVMITPDVVNPVTAACERYEIPCISLGVPVEAWLADGPYRWSFMAFWSIENWADLYIGMWDKFAGETNKVVGGIFPNDPESMTMPVVLKRKLEAKGYRFIDPGRFPYFNKDYSSIINQFKRENVSILTGAMLSPDWTAAWRQSSQLGFTPKIATIAKALLFPAALLSLGGDLGHGLTCEIWWSKFHPYKSSLTGESPKDVCDTWEKETNLQWTPSLGFKHAGMEMVANALNRAGSLEKKSLREAILTMNLNTIIGPIKWDARQVCETPLVGGQWVRGKRWPYEVEIVHNARNPEIPITADLMFPLPSRASN